MNRDAVEIIIFMLLSLEKVYIILEIFIICLIGNLIFGETTNIINWESSEDSDLDKPNASLCSMGMEFENDDNSNDNLYDRIPLPFAFYLHLNQLRVGSVSAETFSIFLLPWLFL